ncbi:MAG TPA: transposase [Nannocystaceae bacterium]|nr:transposase [Nannocystaceae bacterium]
MGRESKRRNSRRRPKQTEIEFRSWGGRRKGAGRKPVGAKAGVAHARRSELPRGGCVHVTLRAVAGIGRLRGRKQWNAVRAAARGVLEREGFRVCELSLMTNHLHLVVEAENRGTLARGMNALCTSLARRLNKSLGRSGRFFGDRYHARILKTPLEVKHALAYVLNNARRHAAQRGQAYASGWCDPFSSARAFTGWRSLSARAGPDSPWLSPPATWLLRVGWRRHGLLDLDAVPG